MIFPFYQQHDDACVLIPTLSLYKAECSCNCGTSAVILTLDFLVWSIGIGRASH